MIIRKFLHSCILVEENGKKLLFDPGAFSFLDKKLKPEDIGPVDVIVLTHRHPDHYFPEALKTITSLKPTPIVAHAEIGKLLKEEGLSCETIQAGETKQIAGLNIAAFEAPHGCLPLPIPHNLAYIVNGKILHPGDSFEVKGLKPCEVMLLPIAGPWATLTEAVNFAKKVKPKTVIPIHDFVIKDFFLERMYWICGEAFKDTNISFKPLKMGEELEV